MNTKLSSNWLFLKQSFKKFKTQGSFLPSSKFLGKQMLRPLKMTDSAVVVELGAGTGAFTSEIISRLPPTGKLILVEINSKQAEHLREHFSDKRVLIIEGDAANLKTILAQNEISKVDYVISGLPLGNFSRQTVNKILQEIHGTLKDDGLYIQFQYLLVDWLNIKRVFKVKIATYELRNLPPAFVYYCIKK